MSDGLQRRLYVNNRLEELRSKYGHEKDWPENQPLQSDVAEAGTPVMKATEAVPLPPQKRADGGGVTPTAGLGSNLLDQLDL